MAGYGAQGHFAAQASEVAVAVAQGSVEQLGGHGTSAPVARQEASVGVQAAQERKRWGHPYDKRGAPYKWFPAITLGVLARNKEPGNGSSTRLVCLSSVVMV
jgi:hypothetical protein